jgi:hypothetical protein
VAVLTFLVALVTLAGAKGAIQEIEGFIRFLISAVVISGASVVDAVLSLKSAIQLQALAAAASVERQPAGQS